jgi:4'-phosphopantetheinyl transferase
VNARRDQRADVTAREPAAERKTRTTGTGDSSAHLHYAAIDDVDSCVIAALPPAELARLPPTARAARRSEHQAGRALLRTALEDVTGRPALEHDLRTTARGKPVCAGGPYVSVSHSGRWVACAIAPGLGVGIDVQVAAPSRPVEALAQTFFSPLESRWLADQPRERFYMLWVLKEAYLKALGLGLAGGLNALQCRVEPPVVEVVAARSARATISIRLYALEDAFVALATAEGRLGEIVTKRWSPGGEPRWLPGALQFVAAS